MRGLNPFVKPEFVTQSGAPVADFRFGNRQERAIGQNGEINASNVEDLLQNINQMMTASHQGQIIKKKSTTPDERKERLAVFTAAFNDKSGEQWSVLGASIAEAIKQQGDREGFLRRLVMGQPLEQGQMPRVPMPAHDAVAVVATSAAAVEYQLIRNKVFTPPEFAITSNLRVENIELQQVSGDILENIYNQGVESIMVCEDRLWKQAANATINMENPLQYISGQLTPDILAAIQNNVAQWNLPTTTALIANDFWKDLIGNASFHSLFDPVTRYDLVLNGAIGTIFGMEVITDAFRQPNQKVLNRGEIYVIASPENHGSYTDRGGIVPTPVDGATTGTSTKGWFMEEFFSLVLANPRSVAVGRRI